MRRRCSRHTGTSAGAGMTSSGSWTGTDGSDRPRKAAAGRWRSATTKACAARSACGCPLIREHRGKSCRSCWIHTAGSCRRHAGATGSLWPGKGSAMNRAGGRYLISSFLPAAVSCPDTVQKSLTALWKRHRKCFPSGAQSCLRSLLRRCQGTAAADTTSIPGGRRKYGKRLIRSGNSA